jgi:predicted HTH domain antitoxin
MTVTIPNERIEDIQLSEHDALIDIAIGLYKRDEISIGRAAEVAGITTPEILAELGRRKIEINYDIKDLQEDIENLRRLNDRRQ